MEFYKIFREAVNIANEERIKEARIQKILKEYDGRAFVFNVRSDGVYVFHFSPEGIRFEPNPEQLPDINEAKNMYLETDLGMAKRLVYKHRHLNWFDKFLIFKNIYLPRKYRNITLRELRLIEWLLCGKREIAQKSISYTVVAYNDRVMTKTLPWLARGIKRPIDEIIICDRGSDEELIELELKHADRVILGLSRSVSADLAKLENELFSLGFKIKKSGEKLAIKTKSAKALIEPSEARMDFYSSKLKPEDRLLIRWLRERYDRPMKFGRARNIAAEHAEGDIIVSMEIETWLPPETPKRLEEAFEDEEVVSVVPEIQIYPWEERERLLEDRFYHWLMNLTYKSLGEAGVCFGKGDFQAFRKEAFRKIGGYRELYAAEDGDIIFRISKLGKVRYGDFCVYESPQRYREWGYPQTLAYWISRGLLWSLGLDLPYEEVSKDFYEPKDQSFFDKLLEVRGKAITTLLPKPLDTLNFIKEITRFPSPEIRGKLFLVGWRIWEAVWDKMEFYIKEGIKMIENEKIDEHTEVGRIMGLHKDQIYEVVSGLASSIIHRLGKDFSCPSSYIEEAYELVDRRLKRFFDSL